MARSFSEDGAAGANDAQGGVQDMSGSAVGGVQMHDPGPAAAPAAPLTAQGTNAAGQSGYRIGNYWGMNPGGASISPGPSTAGQPQNTAGGGFWGMGFSQGGAVPEDDGGRPDVSAALSTLDSVLAYGRQKHGLGGDSGVKTAGAMPTIPGTQSESGNPPTRPMPGPPASVPFGQRGADAGGGIQTAANMPTIPSSQSESGVPPVQPMPGPLPPTANPFGKRADAGGIDDNEEAAS